MTIEVINGSATLDGTEQAIGSTTAFHPRASVYLPALVGAANIAAALKSVWRIYSISDGITSLIATGIWADPSQNTVLLANVPAQGATVKLTVQAALGSGATVAGSLVGWDQGDQITPTTQFANGSIALTNVEQDVCTLAAAYTLQNVTVNPKSDPLADRSIWRLYAVVNSVRYQIGAGKVLKSNLLQQTLIANVVTGAQAYVLTAQGGFGNSAVSITGVIFGSSDSTTGSGGGGGGGGLPILGDVIINPGDATKNDVVAITGAAGIVNIAASAFVFAGGIIFDINAGTPVFWLSGAATDFIAIGTSAAQSGYIRLPINTATPTVLLSARNNVNLADLSIIGTDASNGYLFGSIGGTSNLIGTIAQLTSNSQAFQFRSDVGGIFISGGANILKVVGFAGAWVTTSDANLTGYDWNLNGGNSLLGIRANWNIGAITSGGSVSYDGTTINFKIGGGQLGGFTATQFKFARGLNIGTPLQVAGAVTLTATTRWVVGTASAVVTLPISPSDGDCVSFFSRVGALTLNGNGKNILLAGTSSATQPVAAGTCATVCYDATSTLWLMSPGY